jgi:hypothetical protein
MKQKIKKAIEEPGKIAPYLYWNTLGNLHCLPYRLFYDKQYNKLHKDLFKEEKFLLIILDACRYDYFFDEYRNFFKGDLKPVYSSGRNTFEYTKNTYDGDHTDMLYVSGALPINPVYTEENAPKLYKGKYLPKEHLRIEDVCNKAWNPELGTVPPEEVTKATIENKEEKMVAHCFQPHSPFIGDYNLLEHAEYPPEREAGGDEPVWNRFNRKEIEEKEIRRAYRSNLRRALNEARKLAEKFDDRRIVITSDHGELFGEGGLYGHPPRQHPNLRKLPWLEVEDTIDNPKYEKLKE